MIAICDNALEDPGSYRAAALARPFSSVTFGDQTFHGIQVAEDPALPLWLARNFPELTPTLSFLRQSPAGQIEPNYVHTDREMGEWTAILYLNPDPPPGDGTTFWRHRATGATVSTPALEDPRVWQDQAQWDPRLHVEAVFNRVLLFSAPCFHSRSLFDNYGAGADARLVHVVFGTGPFPQE